MREGGSNPKSVIRTFVVASPVSVAPVSVTVPVNTTGLATP